MSSDIHTLAAATACSTENGPFSINPAFPSYFVRSSASAGGFGGVKLIFVQMDVQRMKGILARASRVIE